MLNVQLFEEIRLQILSVSLWFVGGVIAFDYLTFRPARSRLVVPEAETRAVVRQPMGARIVRACRLFQLLNNVGLLI